MPTTEWPLDILYKMMGGKKRQIGLLTLNLLGVTFRVLLRNDLLSDTRNLLFCVFKHKDIKKQDSRHSVLIQEILGLSDFKWYQLWQIDSIKYCHFDKFEGSEFWFWEISAMEICKNSPKSKFKPAKTVKDDNF